MRSPSAQFSLPNPALKLTLRFPLLIPDFLLRRRETLADFGRFWVRKLPFFAPRSMRLPASVVVPGRREDGTGMLLSHLALTGDGACLNLLVPCVNFVRPGPTIPPPAPNLVSTTTALIVDGKFWSRRL